MIIGVALDEDDPEVVVPAEVGDALVDVFGMEEVVADPEEDSGQRTNRVRGTLKRSGCGLTKGRALRRWLRLGNRI